MRKIVGFLLLLTLISYSCGCVNKTVTSSSKDTKQPTEYGIKVKAKSPRTETTKENNGDVDSVSVYNNTVAMVGDAPPPPPPPPNTIQTANGTLVYKVDSVLTIGVVSRVEARIIKKIGQSTTDQLVQMTTHTTTGVIQTEVIKVGNIMDMDLISLQSDVFEINKISSGDQPVDQTTVTEWLWGVTALKTGNYNLILKAKVRENGVSRDKIVFDKQINVKNKPKKFYTMNIEIPEKLLRYEDNTIKLSLKERQGDTYQVEWGGKGKVQLDFPDLKPGQNVKITEVDNYEISDDKSLFNYKWIVQPGDIRIDSLRCVIKIVGDYNEEIISDRYVKIDKNIKGTFERFIDGAAKNWYWVFTALLIPLYQVIKKKYFPEKKIFRRKRRTTTKKT